MSEIKIRVSTHDNDTTSISLEIKGTSLEMELGGAKASVDLSGLIPASKSDRFLSDVQYNAQTKKVVFVTSAKDEEDKNFEISLTDLVDVFTLNLSQDEGNALELREDGLYVKKNESASGTDLSDVPEHEFKPGSKVLAFDEDGNLYKFAEASAYYKDLAIELSSENGKKLENENTQYAVTARISNTKGTEVSSATIALSAGGIMRDFVVHAPDSVFISNESDGNYIIANLAGYGVVTISFNVEVSNNTYVSGSVAAVGDTVSSNNSATLNLTKIATSQKANNTHTEACPYVQATVVGDMTNTPLAVGVQTESAGSFYEKNITRYSYSNNDGLTILPSKRSYRDTRLATKT